MDSMFKLGDKVQIKYRDEIVEGVVDEIGEKEFHVTNVGWFPNDVGNYVQKVGDA